MSGPNGNKNLIEFHNVLFPSTVKGEASKKTKEEIWFSLYLPSNKSSPFGSNVLFIIRVRFLYHVSDGLLLEEANQLLSTLATGQAS